jgi:hypothetical protein
MIIHVGKLNRTNTFTTVFMTLAVLTLSGFTYPEKPIEVEPEPVKTEQQLQVEAFEAKNSQTSIYVNANMNLDLATVKETYTVNPPKNLPRHVIRTMPARDYAKAIVNDEEQFKCLEQLWDRESKWNHLAVNPSSGAYGIPQSYPASKMASAGADWRTNPETQINWGLQYIEGRYGTPCAAWAHSERTNWY